MPKARTVKTSKKRKLTGKGFKDVAKKVAKVAIPIAVAIAGAVAAKKLHTGYKGALATHNYAKEQRRHDLGIDTGITVDPEFKKALTTYVAHTVADNDEDSLL